MYIIVYIVKANFFMILSILLRLMVTNYVTEPFLTCSSKDIRVGTTDTIETTC